MLSSRRKSCSKRQSIVSVSTTSCKVKKSSVDKSSNRLRGSRDEGRTRNPSCRRGDGTSLELDRIDRPASSEIRVLRSDKSTEAPAMEPTKRRSRSKLFLLNSRRV
eukprot:Gregarina_sp_Poly_1__10381@NODE_743_length_6482_cov_29_105846_g554_i0_p7_GENE_NODE_743_length_6482_cov_29_105846_g554_i0NODE_743_length_6482_cov_29_105846_g554_i0_p7_ORF_typecomplete_len106_score16_98_NODE_743_length_6482_cov_29_105846_g554_i037684085